MKPFVFYFGIVVLLASCTTTKEGYYAGKANYHNASSMEVAVTTPHPFTATKENIIVKPVNDKTKSISENNFQSDSSITIAINDMAVLSASKPVVENEPILTVNALRTRMAGELRLEAGTIENKFAGRILNKTANKIEVLNLNTKTHLSFFDKLKAKLFTKLQAKFAVRGGMAMADILAIVSLVTGILALGAFYGSFLLGLAAIITGAIALRKGTSRRIMAIVGIILGVVAMLFWSGWIFLY
jgi:PBP1b-binding outer membrane lipoprotein LpoB